MTPVQFALASAVVLVGAIVQGSVGFGANLVAGPLLLLIDPSLVPGPALITGLALTSLMWWRDRGATDRRGLRWGLLGRIPGSALGAASVALLPTSGLEVALGTVILVAVTVTATRVRVVPTPGTMLGAGVVSGFFTSTAAIGGPPVALVYQRLPGPTVRSTIASLATIGGAVSIIFLRLAGELPAREVWLGLALVPGLLIGFQLSHRLAGVLDRGYTRSAILALCASSGIAVVLRGAL